ncbi:MAG: GNAT family N-acetyltransferase [Syntrophales bacterium]
MKNHPTDIRVEEITTLEALEAIRPEWYALWEQCPRATPFQSPDWLLPWWRYFGKGSLWVLALRQNGDLAGLAPLFMDVQDCNLSGPSIRFIGTGISDYLDILLRPAAEEPGIRLFTNKIVNQSPRWDSCDFEEVRPESPLLTVVLPGGLALRSAPMTVCPVITLPDTVDSYIAGLPSKHRRSLRRAERLLQQSGEFRIEKADAETLPEFLDTLFVLHRARWGKRNLPGVLENPHIQSFHREVSTMMLKRGILLLYRLVCNGTTASILYTFECRRRNYCYLSAFNPELERLSPGAVIMGHAITEGIRRGNTEFDLLRGNEPYKYLWGGRDRPNFRIIIEKVKN